ncbi:MoaC-domain-containing protein [Byssothecium circinans]|uniref:cyclic pyranopterin monophosphate synthase n=1 Tax=Byssothecium circinans TaxID=147558 RepID=A0A6A5TCH6_9PLEO|nr:MoaC-domain-containing protein [Byssothecium circinans]
MVARRGYSTSSKPSPTSPSSTPAITKIESTSTAGPSLPHLTSTGTPHMVSVSGKAQTLRTAIATGTIHFGNPMPFKLIRSNSLEKGDVLSVSRIAGIMAAKRCPDFVPLCHPIMLTHVGVKLALFRGSEGDDGKRGFGGVVVEAKVQCEGQTGVEMEALTSVMGAALSVVDMCKAVDKAMVISDVRVVLKEGGRSGKWEEPGWKSVEEGGV